MAIYKFKSDDAERFANQQGIPARRSGSELIFQKCPYCGRLSRDKEKFSINMTTGQFQCFRASCGAKGNMITLSKDFSFSLGNEADAYFRETRQFRDISWAEKPAPKSAAVEYMASRGISEEVTNRYCITVQREHENVLVFPFYDENSTLQFVKYRYTDFDRKGDKSKEWCEKGCKPICCHSENLPYEVPEGYL